MKRRNWNSVQPNSLRDAMELCKEFALSQRNMSVERISDQMGMADRFTLYKWLSTGRMPAVLIPAYEAACGCSFVTRWLAGAAGKLVIDIPTGRKCTGQDIQLLQQQLHSATGALMAFHDGQMAADEVLAAIRTAMEGLGWHHRNVAQHIQPQLELGGAHE
ncbi:hypothetical protein WP8S17C03_22970 [Metapseudomonas otitidis]|uniref:Uncharacterized protein n=1 Tax=Metapseudomonas otitidis TaxID=319939 RepID=A0A6S5RLY1_9GAMM|nr:hypothetical protein [Pseudomonas otitidis]BBT16248.1 hypothetical protein WP8S17C03_22970 [Pseudomonas otitidis]